MFIILISVATWNSSRSYEIQSHVLIFYDYPYIYLNHKLFFFNYPDPNKFEENQHPASDI